MNDSEYLELAEKQLEEGKPINLDCMDSDYRFLLHEWIDLWIRKSNKSCLKLSSYEIKHIAEEMLGFYVSECQLKQAMIIKGYYPINPKQVNWNFKIHAYPFYYIYMEYGIGHMLRGFPNN